MTTDASTPPIALSIAGSDSGGGAGIQADLKTFAAYKTFGTTVVTMVTAQSTSAVDAIQVLDPQLVRQQYQTLLADLPPMAAKTGALGNDQMVCGVASMLADDPIENLVIDPVMISKHGHPLMDESVFETVGERLLPHGLIATPNRFEAQALSGMERVETPAQMREAARRIHDRGPKSVVVKGGHFDRIVRDIFYDGSGFVEFGADRIDSERVHGSGCTFSAAICAGLANGHSLTDALGQARDFISRSIDTAPPIGGGVSPVHPLHQLWSHSP